MEYKVIIFDIDGTITRHISSWRYIHERLGLWDDIADRYQKAFLAGRVSYKKFCELDAACWKRLPEKRITGIFKNIRYSKNACSSLRQLKTMGFKLAAISTGLQFVADKIKKEFGFDYVLSNRLLSRKGILTGRVKINITHGAKGKVLKDILKRFDVRAGEVISVGDSAGDIPLAKLTGYSIAFNSTSRELSRIVDYDCKTNDFSKVFKKIVDVSFKNE